MLDKLFIHLPSPWETVVLFKCHKFLAQVASPAILDGKPMLSVLVVLPTGWSCRRWLQGQTSHTHQTTLTCLGAVHKCQHFHECTNHTLSERPSPPKKSTHQHFLSAKNPHENNKNQAKTLKVYGNVFDFHRHPPLKVYGLYTCENVDIYGQPLKQLAQKILILIFFTISINLVVGLIHSQGNNQKSDQNWEETCSWITVYFDGLKCFNNNWILTNFLSTITCNYKLKVNVFISKYLLQYNNHM